MINNVVLVGRITKDPELMKTPSGTSYCRFTVACDRRTSSQNGQRTADFIPCVAWQRTAEIMCQYLRKGRLIGVEGRVSTSSYDNQQGQRVFKTEITANSVQFLESRNASDNGDWNRSNSYGQQSNSYGQQSGYQNSSYQNAPQPAYNSYQSSGSSYSNHSAGNDPFGAPSSNSFDSAFDDDSLDIASDDLPF